MAAVCFVCLRRYTDQQLDREFIEVLRETCYKLVERSEVRMQTMILARAGAAGKTLHGV